MRGFVIAPAMAAALLCSVHLGAATAATDDTRALPAPSAESGVPQDDGLLPANYRRFVAVKLLKMYLQDGDGQAEISQPRESGIFYKTPHFVVRFRLSPSGANGMLLSFQNPPPRRYRCVEIGADRAIFSGKPVMSFRYPRNDPGDICDRHVAFEPFTELERMAGKVQACLSRGEKQCVIADAVAKPDAKADAKTAAKPATLSKKRREAKPATATE